MPTPRRLEVTPLEDRLAPATLADAGGRTLTVTLAPGEALQVRAAVGRVEFFSNSQTFANAGVSSAGSFGGLGTRALTLNAPGNYDAVRVVDSGRGAAVDFLDSGASVYGTGFAVSLGDPNAGQVRFFGNSSFGAFGVGVATTRGVEVTPSASLTATTGAISLSGNLQAAPTAGGFIGVLVYAGASVLTGGALTLAGRGGIDAGEFRAGVALIDGSRVVGGAAAETRVVGIGGGGAGGLAYGVSLNGANTVLGTSGGPLRVEGTGGAGPGASNVGVVINNGARVAAGGAGSTTVTGAGGANSSDAAVGVFLLGGSVLTSAGAGAVVVTGTGGATGGQADGVRVQDVNTLLGSGGGAVSVVGTGGGSGRGNVNIGVQVSRGATLSSGPGAPVTVRGTGGLSAGTENNGVRVEGDDQNGPREARLTSGGGDVTVVGVGRGAAGGAGDNQGVHVLNRGTITSGGAGAVSVDGTGGLGTLNNQGVSVDSDPGSGRLSRITSGGAGAVRVVGRGDLSGLGSQTSGVFVGEGGLITSGGGPVFLDGTGGASPGGNGVQLVSALASVGTGGGALSLVGRGGPGGGSTGVLAQGGALVTAAGLAPVTIDGTGGSGAAGGNRGVWVLLAGTRVTTGGGNLQVVGRSGAGANSEAVLVATPDGAVAAAAPPGTTTITDATGTSPPPVVVIPPVVVPPAVPPVVVVPPTPAAARLVGSPQFAAGADAGGAAVARLFNPDGSERYSIDAFPGFTGGVRVAAADFTGDGVADLIVGTGPGVAGRVRVLDGVTQAELFSAQPFEASFTGGVFVAAGDITGDGVPDLVVTPDQTGGPRVVAYSGATFTTFVSYYGIDDPNFRGGARAAVADVNGDGRSEILVAAGFGGGPRVTVWDGASAAAGAPRALANFFAFEQTLRNGVYIAAGDVDGDGRADLIVGGGPGGGPRVSAFGAASLLVTTPNNQPGDGERIVNFFAGDPNNRGGVRVGVKNLDGDARADLVTGAGENAGSRVGAYTGAALAAGGSPPALREFDAFAGFGGGVFVG